MTRSRDPRQWKRTRHHRKPRFLGGIGKENISRVFDHRHKAFHTLFAWGNPAAMVAQVLNSVWLAHDEVLVPIPTAKLLDVLKYLDSVDIPIPENSIGITAAHRKLFGVNQ